jgi:hypothetical protein
MKDKKVKVTVEEPNIVSGQVSRLSSIYVIKDIYNDVLAQVLAANTETSWHQMMCVSRDNLLSTFDDGRTHLLISSVLTPESKIEAFDIRAGSEDWLRFRFPSTYR